MNEVEWLEEIIRLNEVAVQSIDSRPASDHLAAARRMFLTATRLFQQALDELKGSEMSRFYLRRDTDVSGISGTGIVAEGVQFSNKWVALTWLSEHTSVVFYPSMADVYAIHGHSGSTKIVWLDDPPADTPVPTWT